MRAVWTSPDVVHVEARRSSAGSEPERARTLSFRATDPELDRWETIGLVAGALSAAIPDVEEPQVLDEAVAPGEPRNVFPRGWLGLGVLVGSGLDDERPRLGGTFDAGLGLGPLPLELALTAALSAPAHPPEGLALRWIALSPALGTAITWESVGVTLRARVGPHLHGIHARLIGPADVGRGTRWVGGFGGAVDLYWPSDAWSAWLGLEAWRLSGATALMLDEARIGSSPALGGLLRFGIAWTFGQLP